MANRKLTWIFELFDKISQPAKAMKKALGEFGDESKHAKDTFDSFALRLDAGLRIGERVFHVAEGFAEIGMSIGEAAIEAASFKETTLVALETVLGSGKAARDVFSDTVKLASKLPITTEDALNAASRLALAGFQQKDLGALTLASADVKAISGQEGMEGFLRQLTDIQSVGLSDRHLMFLSQQTHIPENKILEQLSQISGVKGDEKAMKKVVSQGAFDKTTSVNAVLRALAGIEGGQLGNLSGKLSQTVSGLFSTLKSRKLEFLMDLDNSPAYATFRKFLSNLATALDPNSAFGARVKAAIGRTFDSVFGRMFGDFAGEAGAANLEDLLEKVLRGAQLVGVAFEAAAAFAKGFGEDIARALGLSGGLFGPDGTLDKNKVEELVSKFEVLGQKVAQVVELMGKAMGPLISAVTPYSKEELAQIEQQYKPPPPSSWDGFMSGAARFMFGDPNEYIAAHYGAPATAGSARGHQITVNVHAPGATREDAKAIEKHAEIGARKALDAAHDHASLQPN